jgi:hypothetical protein
MGKKLKYFDNKHILCSHCDKPVYMGYTSKSDSELCTCNNIPERTVYDSRNEEKKILPLKAFEVYE